MSARSKGHLGIVVSGGPAPGINSVISAAVIEATNRGYAVKGFVGGFRFADATGGTVVDLSIKDVSRVGSSGGSILGTSRVNPLADPEHESRFRETLRREGVDKLIVIGGDGSAFLAHQIGTRFPEVRVVHVPKTIDNDLILPNNYPSFGFETARSVGTHAMQALMVDAKTCDRWFVAVTMGRSAGFLALGLGIAAGTTLTIIPEEFPEQIPLSDAAEIIVGSIKQRSEAGKHYGVALIAEGVLDRIDPSSSSEIAASPRDHLGRINYAELDLGTLLLPVIRTHLIAEKIGVRVNAISIGYELRCHDPISFDLEYTRLLGYGAVELLDRGEGDCMVVRDFDKLSHVRLSSMIGADGKIRSRKVDLNSDLYRVARSYMIRD